MTIDIQASGFVGIAFETVAGTYVAPTKYFPIKSETLKLVQQTHFRRVIRGIADVLDPGIQGNFNVEGEIQMEVMEDALPYFLHVSRNSIAKSGTTDFTYTTTPTQGVFTIPKPGMSITVVRSGAVFGYVGCVVTQMVFTVDEGIPIVTFTILGLDEASQTLPTPSWLTTSVPFAPGQFSIQIPTATQVFDVDNYTITINDNGEPQFRLSDTRATRFIKFGERDVTATMERDFVDRTHYDAFKAMTATSLTVELTKAANKKVTITLPKTYQEDHTVGQLQSQGDLVRSSITYRSVYDPSTSKAYEIEVISQEDIS